MTDLRLPLDAFIRSVAVSRGTPHSLFLGAGASVSSRVPSAERCIWEWKKDIFITNNPGLERHFAELSLPAVRDKIQRWLDTQGGYPPSGHRGEYGFYIERCFPISEDRRLFFQERIRTCRPSIGYKLLCSLAEAGIINTVWTTNFDGLVTRAASDFSLTPVEVGIDSQERLPRSGRQSELLCVSMHGDYRYDRLKNTLSEIQRQESQLREALISHFRNHPAIVCGYSGRDESIMAALADAYSSNGTGTIFWCGYGDSDIPPLVLHLLEAVRRAGRPAHFVHTDGFDDLFVRLAFRCLQGEALERAHSIVEAVESGSERRAFSIPTEPPGAIIKSNAFQVRCPSEVFEFELHSWPEGGVWRWLDELTLERDVIAVPLRGKVLAIGTLDDIHETFGELISGPVNRVQIVESELTFPHGAIISLLRRSLVRAIAVATGLDTDGHGLLWTTSPDEERRFDGFDLLIFESALISLRRIGEAMYVVVKPSIRAFDTNREPIAKDLENRLKLAVLGWQHNAEFNQAMDRWRVRLFPNDLSRFEFPPNCGSTFRFTLQPVPAFAKLSKPNGRTIRVADRFKRHIHHAGTELKEPKLVFASKDARSRPSDCHPIRGMIQNRPYDYSLTVQGLADDVRLAVVCPQAESTLVAEYLRGLHQRQRPSDSERDYLLDYPGFQEAYGVPVEVPGPHDPRWVICPGPDESTTAYEGATELARMIRRSIDTLESAHSADVVLIFVPDRWAKWRRVETEDELFDLHNFVKAYCVQRGVATQFLEQDTLRDPQQCRVWWWLSLAIYVKSMRTPWVLQSLDEDTAFVGLGFSIDPKAARGQHVVLGCSHIYNAQGEGLQYRLTKVEKPTIRGKNPFMSKDDARRTGEVIQQLFYDAKMRLPRRVVIHKRTPFLADERQGLRQGLNGVEGIDMLEISIDDTLRYVASVAKSDGTFDEDNYPVRRGSVVLLDRYRALLWVHGVTAALNPPMRYYQGKRRIPAPLLIKRHAGESDLATIAHEILALSKMNWNTFDMYTKLPATIQSSGEIARIGSLLERFGARVYDYRLFI